MHCNDNNVQDRLFVPSIRNTCASHAPRRSAIASALHDPMARTLAPNLVSLYSGCACYFLSGSTTVFDEPSGAACMPGALSPCGLEAGAPPDLVLIWPVQPCGCN